MDRESRAISVGRQRLEDLRATIEHIEVEGLSDPLIDSTLEKSPFKGELKKVEKAASDAERAVDAALAQIRNKIDSAEAEIDKVFATWKTRRAEADKALKKIKSELEAEHIDHQAFRDVQQRVDELAALQPDLKREEKGLHRAAMARAKLLARRERLEGDVLSELRKAARSASGRLARSVRVEVESRFDHAELEKLVRGGGARRIKEALELFAESPTFSGRGLAGAARIGADEIEKQWGTTAQQAAMIAGLAEDVLMKLEELPLWILTSVQLNTARDDQDPTWVPLERLSKGQKASLSCCSCSWIRKPRS